MPNIVSRTYVAALAAVKAFVINWASGGSGRPLLIGTQYDYASKVGDGTNASVVMAPVLWMARTFPEAPVRVLIPSEEGQFEPVSSHPMIDLLERPNPYYSGALLWMATIVDWVIGGNAYWLKGRSGLGRPETLWWVPQRLLEPRWPSNDPTVFISHYEYRINGQTYEIPTTDVVHFRYGLDPANVRKGLSPLGSLFREIFTDEEAANFGASLLKNLGIPGVVIAPSTDIDLTGPETEEIKNRFMEKFSGDRRGEPLVLSARVQPTVLSFNPQQMDLKNLRRVPEERVTAILGVPAIVSGLGAGLDRSCVPAYARVQTPTGTKTIAEIEAGMVVWSFKDGCIVPRLVEHKWPARRDMVYEVRTNNRRLRATGNHPLMVRVPGNSDGPNDTRQPSYEWRKIEDLKAGDHIIFAKAYPDQGETILPDGRPATADMLQFLGAVIGDGTVSKPGVRIAMPPTDRCVEQYQALASELFTNRSGGAVVLQRRDRDFGFSSASASRELAVLGVAGRAHTKRVPTWVYGLSRQLRLAFLAGIVDTDGYIDSRGALTVTFCNRALLEDVRDLAISLGIRVSNVGYRTIESHALPNPGIQGSYEAWMFTASSAVQVAEIPFVDPLYRERVETNPNRYRSEGFDAYKAGLSADLGFAEIKAIVPLGEDDVYDLTVEDGHSFFCENTLVSNTFANFAEAREAAYESNIIPTQRLFASELKSQLLPDFDPQAVRRKVEFDNSGVRVLQEDENKKWDRYGLAAQRGLITVAAFKRAVGQKPEPTDEIYLRGMSVAEVPIGTKRPLALPAPAAEQEPLALPPGEPEEEEAEAGKGLRRYKGLTPEAKVKYGDLFVKRVSARENRFREAMLDYFDAHGQAVIARMRKAGKAGEGETKAIADDLFDEEFFDEWLDRLKAIGRPLIKAYLAEAADEAVSDFALGISFDLGNPRVTKWIGDRLKRFGKEVSETTVKDVTRILQAGEQAGQSIDTMTAGIRAYFDGIDYRAERVARTEVVGASNRGAFEAYQQAGVEEKEWLATGDDRTREHHLEADGQIVPLDQPFDVMGEQIMHPGEGSAENAINCRCTIAPVMGRRN